MAVSVQDGALKWVASIETDQLEKQVDVITKELTGVAESANKTVDAFTKKTTQGVNQLSQSIETLRAKILAREDFIVRETDLNKIAQYNKEIEALKLQLTQILSAGKTGFDNFGNAIKTQVGLLEKLNRQAAIYKTGIQQATNPANIAKYNQKLQETNLQITKLSNAGKKGFDDLGNATGKLTGKANLLSKGFSFFRTAAFLIPGLGIAGIFNLIGEAVGSLVDALFKGNGALSTFQQNLKNINEVMSKANVESGKQIADLKILYTAATNVNLSMKDRLAAVNALQAEFPEFFGSIKDEIILNGQAQDAYDKLTVSIQKSARARAAKAKIDEIEAQKLDIAFQKLKIENATANEKRRAEEKKQTLVTSTDEFGRAVGTITPAEQIKFIENRRLKALRDEDKKDLSLTQQEKFLISFVGEEAITKSVVDEVTKRGKKVAKINTGESELLALLNKRKKLIEDIKNIERDATQSGMVKEASEIDKINERREKEIELLKQANILIDKYNAQKKNKTKVALIGQDEIDRINKAADIIIKNTLYKQDAEKYLEAVKLKEAAFAELEKAQLTGNTLVADQARETYKDQVGDFSSMVDFLKSEHKRLTDALSLDPGNIGIITSLKGLDKILEDAIKKADNDEKQRQTKKFEELLNTAQTFAQKRFDISKKYNDLEATLERNKGRLSPQEFEQRRKVLQDAREQELTDLDNDLARQSGLYKKMNEDVIRFTRDMLKQRVKELKKILKTDATLTPQMRADLESTIDKLQGLLASTNKVSKAFGKVGKDLLGIANDLGSLGSAFEGVNDDLADLLNSLSTVTNIAGTAFTALSQFASGDILGGIASTVGLITSVIGIGKKAKEERLQHQKEVEDFLTGQIVGEQEINLLYQERARQQVLINKLRIQGLKDEKRLLLEQKDEVVKNYQTIFTELQKQSSKVIHNITTALGSMDLIVEESLFGKSFDEIEQLFLKGQLTDKAKELFLELQKIKDAGVDIDKLLEDNKRAAQELFTGTTADGIIDSIAEGFLNGQRSAEEFADNFQDLMRTAIIQSLKFKFLEGPLKQFFEDFAAASESDGQLTTGEIDRLKAMYNTIITNAADQFDQLQQIAGINFNSPGSADNSLTGAIRGISEQQADLLAGQFGGLRLTAIQQLQVATRGIESLQNIELNTAWIKTGVDLWRRIELDGLKIK